MYAIISDSGRQYTVKEGDVLAVDYREAEKGSKINFEKVWAVSFDRGMTVVRPISTVARDSSELLGKELG